MRLAPLLPPPPTTGTSRILRQPARQVVTLWYRAPEILMGGRDYSAPVDAWSIGCIVAEMVKLQPLFNGDCEIDELYKIFRVCGAAAQPVVRAAAAVARQGP